MNASKFFLNLVLMVSFCGGIAYPFTLFGAANFGADIVVSIPVGGGTVETGETFPYEIEVLNNPEPPTDLPADNVVLTLDLPDEGALASSPVATQGACIETPLGSNQFSCDLGGIDIGEIVRVTLEWTAPGTATTLTLNAEATTTTGEVDNNTANNSASVDTIVEEPPPPPPPDEDGGCGLSSSSTQNRGIFGFFLFLSLPAMFFFARRQL